MRLYGLAKKIWKQYVCPRNAKLDMRLTQETRLLVNQRFSTATQGPDVNGYVLCSSGMRGR